MVDVNDEVFTEEDFYLCKMFGEDCRFVEFVNQTGREIVLTSRLEIERFPNMAWSTKIPISPSQTHVWRFLGDAQHQSDQLSYLTILPEPWNLSRDNLFSWTASFADTTEEDSIIFDQKTEKLQLQTLPELGAKEAEQEPSRENELADLVRAAQADPENLSEATREMMDRASESQRAEELAESAKVWTNSQTRENSIELNDEKIATIKTIMSGVKLRTVPNWANQLNFDVLNEKNPSSTEKPS